MSAPGSARFAVMSLLSVAMTGIASAQQPLSSYFPDHTNAAASIKVAEFYDSEIAKREGWSRAAPLAGLNAVPGWVNELVLAAHVQPSSTDSQWMITLVPLPESLTFDQIAEQAPNPVEELAGRGMFRTRRGDIAVELGPNLLGVMRPGVRQTASRWIRSLESDGRFVPPYLTRSLNAAGQIVLALDLVDAIGAPRAQEWLASQPEEIVPPAAAEAVAQALAGTEGCQLSITAANELTAEVRIDFKEPLSVEAEHLKAVFLTVLADLGAQIPDLADARPGIEGSAFVLRGPLSADGLKRIITLVGSPSAESEAPPAPSTPPRVASTAEIAERYFLAIDDILRHLQSATRRASSQARVPVWFDNFAYQIDAMETTGVPPELVEFGGRVASDLRAIAASSRGVRVNVDANLRKVTYDVWVDPPTVGIGLWGWGAFRPGSVTVNTNLAQQRARAIDAVAAGQQQRDEIWRMVVEDRAATLRQMRMQFGSSFARQAGER